MSGKKRENAEQIRRIKSLKTKTNHIKQVKRTMKTKFFLNNNNKTQGLVKINTSSISHPSSC